MIGKTDERILNLMVEKINRLLEIHQGYSEEEIKTQFILSDAVQYEFEKLYEDSTRLSFDFRVSHPDFPTDKLRGIRNRVAHDYASVQLNILINTIKDNLPDLKEAITNILQNK